LIWAAPQDLFQIAGDSGDLEILAKKLIDNSIKFNRPGGAVKVQISAEGDAAVTLDIIDSGIGIEADQFDRILQPFAQIDEGYTRAVDGTGLGLCIAERIAKRHGTSLKIRSTFGKGSAFSITFARKVADNVTNVGQPADAQLEGYSVVPERRVA
jgi:two-component system phosphate regulon sensor histidine kinase PhoR